MKSKKTFLKIINELDNGYKHELLVCEADSIIGTEDPIISIIRPKKRRNYDYIIHHRHGLNQIMAAFADFMKELYELFKVSEMKKNEYFQKNITITSSLLFMRRTTEYFYEK